MRSPAVPEIKTAGYAALLAASASAAKASSPSDAVQRFLRALLDAELISSGLVEIDSKPVLRISVGLDPATVQDELVLKPLPVQSSAAACLYAAGAARRNRAFLSAVAQQLASAIDLAFLREQTKELHKQAQRRIEEVSTIYEIGQAVDAVGIDRLLEIITEKAALVMDGQACSYMRLNPDTKTLTIAASYGLSDDVVVMTQRALGEGIAGRVAQTGEPMLIVDVNDPRLTGIRLMPDIGSSMVVPMKNEHGHVTGVLSIRRRRPTPDFDEDALRLFSVFASQAAMAITNVQLYQDLRSRLVELNTLSSLTQKVISTLDLNSLLEVVADNIVEVVKFDRCAIFLTDRSTGRFAPRILRGYKPEVIGRDMVKVGDGVVGTVARTHVPIIERDARNAAQPLRGFGRMLGTNAYAAIPILNKGNCIGVIVADNKTSGTGFQEDNIALLTTFAGQAGLAIENAQLYEEREQRYQREIKMEAEIGRIRRLADIGQLAAKMAHEVRNPLSSIKGAAQLMRSEYSEIGPLCEFLDIIVDEVNTLNMITTDLLDFARPMKLEIEPVDLALQAERTLQLFESDLSQKGVVAVITADREWTTVDADSKQIGQVMRNIVLNAVQAMPEGGRLTISISRGNNENEVKLEFTDTGIGIPEAKTEEIFQPFVTTKTKGTGLGLSIVRKIVENHSGRISVSSPPAGGATITVAMPARRKESPSSEELRPMVRQQLAAALPDL